jgi:hypothetical protein
MNKMENVYLIGKKIGLKKSDLNLIFKNDTPYPENIQLSTGPFYHGGRYGTTSFYDF